MEAPRYVPVRQQKMTETKHTFCERRTNLDPAVDVAVLVNLRSRRGSRKVVEHARAEMPFARVLASRSMAETGSFIRDLQRSTPDLLLSAGGDGTAVGLINALRSDEMLSLPTIGLLPLGTGNGWANATRAPKWREGLARVGAAARHRSRISTRRFDLVEVCGRIAPFAGTGWDAEMIDDFHAQKTGFGILPEKARNGVAGYLQGLFTRTVPRHLFARERLEVQLTNTGDDAFTIDDSGQPVTLPGGHHGAVLYTGPVGVCGAATSAEWGFGFKSYPFAGSMPRRMCVRVYSAGALEAVSRTRDLWRGVHPLPKMHTWMLTSCKMTFSRPVPFQIGGDRHGHVTEVEYRIADEMVNVLDWRAM
jgi:diacylglycerol kinase family enzyme